MMIQSNYDRVVGSNPSPAEPEEALPPTLADQSAAEAEAADGTVDAFVPEPLSVPEREQLAALEDTVGRHLEGFKEVGLALASIQDQRLYRATDRTFKDYLRRRWGLGKS